MYVWVRVIQRLFFLFLFFFVLSQELNNDISVNLCQPFTFYGQTLVSASKFSLIVLSYMYFVVNLIAETSTSDFKDQQKIWKTKIFIWIWFMVYFSKLL